MTAEPKFCPFCREPFDDVSSCPDHGLPLVAFLELDPPRETSEDALLSLAEPRFGRAVLSAGASVTLVGFMLPFVVDGYEGGRATSAFRLFQEQASYLAVVPAAAFLALHVLVTRRTRRALASVRVGVVGTFALAALALAVATVHVVRYGALRGDGDASALSPGIGAVLLGSGTVLALLGGLRLGAGR